MLGGRPLLIGTCSGFLAAQTFRDTGVASWTTNFPYSIAGEPEIGAMAGLLGLIASRRVDGQTHEKVLEPTTEMIWAMGGGFLGYMIHLRAI